MSDENTFTIVKIEATETWSTRGGPRNVSECMVTAIGPYNDGTEITWRESVPTKLTIGLAVNVTIKENN